MKGQNSTLHPMDRGLVATLKKRVLSQIEQGFGAELSGSEEGMRHDVTQLVGQVVQEHGSDEQGAAERDDLVRAVVAELTGCGPLEPLLEDTSVSDVLINGPGEVWVDRGGVLEKTPVTFDDAEHLMHVLNRIVEKHGRHLNEATPYVDARMGDGSRLHAMIPPLCEAGPVAAIRRARATPLQLEDLIAGGTLSLSLAEFLVQAVKRRLNIVFSGGAATGKTTALSIFSSFIPHGERVITIEETRELFLDHPHIVPLETRLPNAEGRGEIGLRSLLRNALRMRADRIIVGEVRGDEVFDMLQAMNVGHSGSMTTVHANNTADALLRLETLVLLAGFDIPSHAIRELLGAAFDLVVHLERSPDGSRRISSVSEVGLTERGLESRLLFSEVSGTCERVNEPEFLGRWKVTTEGGQAELTP